MTSKSKHLWDRVKQINEIQTFPLGTINADTLTRDPKHLSFTLSRYKFAVKMIPPDCKTVLEVGCGEGLGGFMVVNETPADYCGVDFDRDQITYALDHVKPRFPERMTFLCQDVVSAPLEETFEALISMDVIEHLFPEEEQAFLNHMFSALESGGAAIVGTPNQFSENHASLRSREGHVNLFDPDRLYATLKPFCSQVFIFSMNDEMVHTGFSKMAHYLIALCVKQ